MERRLSSRPLPELSLNDWVPLLRLRDWVPPSETEPEQEPWPEHDWMFVKNDNPFIRLIQNNSVVERLAEYLEFEDFKSLTLASKDCLNCVRNSESFWSRARFNIREPYSFWDNYEASSNYPSSSNSSSSCASDYYENTWDYLYEYDYEDDEIWSNNKLLDLLQPGTYPPRHFPVFEGEESFWDGQTDYGFWGPDDDYYYDKEVDFAEPLYVLLRSAYPWKNLSIQLDSSGLQLENVIPEMEHCLRCVESVLFYTSRSDADELAEWLPFEPLLERMENLREMEIHATRTMLEEKLFSSGEVLHRVFSNLESLKLIVVSKPRFDCPQSHSQHHSNNHWCNSEANILQPCLFSQLKKFCVVTANVAVTPDLCSTIVKIVGAMKDTLEELQMHVDVFQEKEMQTIQFPNLKRLLFEIKTFRSLKAAKAFLLNQVPLEELQIRLTVDYPLGLLQHLQYTGKLKKLQKLCIEAGPLPPYSWTFLKRIRSLKVVHFKYCWASTVYSLREMDETIKGLRESYPWIRFMDCCKFWRHNFYDLPYEEEDWDIQYDMEWD